MRTIAIVPCHKGEQNRLKTLIDSLLKQVDSIIFVDDCCPNNSGQFIEEYFKCNHITVLWNPNNLGVGGAMKRGINFALNNINFDIAIKIDSDGQMNPDDIPKLIFPLLEESADLTKANRYYDFETILTIPKVRMAGNIILSFLAKVSSGYWELFDPNNGFIAIKRSSIVKVPLKKLSDDYFFESDLLFRCNLEQMIIAEVKIPPLYKGEPSSLQPSKQIIPFFKKHCINTAKRILYQYYLYDFNPGSIELLGSFLCLVFATLWGVYLLVCSNVMNQVASAGSTSLFVISMVASLQLFLSFISYDSSQMVIDRKFRSALSKKNRDH